MNANDYQHEALRTSSEHQPQRQRYVGILGLNGEAGELADLLKKYISQGHAEDTEKMVEELGDVLWYCALLAEGLGVSLGDVMQKNIRKLRARYPEGFSAERSRNRGAEYSVDRDSRENSL